jgi:cation diffusion facilitator CzcD-associated flavoprotein CzcO
MANYDRQRQGRHPARVEDAQRARSARWLQDTTPSHRTTTSHALYALPAELAPYIPKDKIAGWFEAYVESMELNYWTATEFEGGSYDEKTQRWSVVLRDAVGSKRVMHPRHVVLATGASGIPNLPDIPTLRNF